MPIWTVTLWCDLKTCLHTGQVVSPLGTAGTLYGTSVTSLACAPLSQVLTMKKGQHLLFDMFQRPLLHDHFIISWTVLWQSRCRLCLQNGRSTKATSGNSRVQPPDPLPHPRWIDLLLLHPQCRMDEESSTRTPLGQNTPTPTSASYCLLSLKIQHVGHLDRRSYLQWKNCWSFS